jgi:hypothetical protein
MSLLFAFVVPGNSRPCVSSSSPPTATPMALLFSLLLSFIFAVSVNATALTTPIAANQKLCFYTDVDKAGEKIGASIPLLSAIYIHSPSF